MRILKIALLSLTLLSAVCGQTGTRTNGINTGSGLSVEYVANEGVLIKSGSKSILLDAIHRNYKPAYAFTPDEILQKIETARFPYNKIDLILVSHYHLDHFHAESIAKHLKNNPKSIIASSEQVVVAVEEELSKLAGRDGKPSAVKNRLRKIRYEWKTSTKFEEDGLKVKFLSLLHANSKLAAFKNIQNFGHIIEIGGKKLLHVGDADMFADNFTAFELEKESIDIAFVPYWFLLSEEGRDILRVQIRAKTIVAIHVPPSGQSTTIRNILGAMPSAIVFSQPGEMLNY